MVRTHRSQGSARRNAPPLSCGPGDRAWSFPGSAGAQERYGFRRSGSHTASLRRRNRFRKGSVVDLHGDKDAELLKWFPSTTPTRAATSRQVTPVQRSSTCRGTSRTAVARRIHRRIWLVGWPAISRPTAASLTDGTVMLNSAIARDLEFVRSSARLGIGTYGITDASRRGFWGREERDLSGFISSTKTSRRISSCSEHRRRFAGIDKAWPRGAGS